MKNFFLFVLITLAFWISACNGNNSKQEVVAPIAQDKFIEVLTDVRLLEATYTLRYQRIDSVGGLMNGYYKQVWEKHKTNQKDFEESYLAYVKNPSVMEVIEDSVITRLQRMSGALNREE